MRPPCGAPCQHSLCLSQVTVGLYHVLGVLLNREQYLSVTTVGYSAVIFGWGAPSSQATYIHH